MSSVLELKRKLRFIWPHLDERTRRITAANEALSLGYGGVSLVRRACGLSRKAIAKGIREIKAGSAPARASCPAWAPSHLSHPPPRADESDSAPRTSAQTGPPGVASDTEYDRARVWDSCDA